MWVNVEAKPGTLTTKRYHGCKVVAFIPIHCPDWHPYPWSFRVTDSEGVIRMFAGTPNQCASRRSALRRGWWRAKWLSEGTFSQRYR